MVVLIHWGCNVLLCGKEKHLPLKPEQCPDPLQALSMWTFFNLKCFTALKSPKGKFSGDIGFTELLSITEWISKSHLQTVERKLH